MFRYQFGTELVHEAIGKDRVDFEVFASAGHMNGEGKIWFEMVFE